MSHTLGMKYQGQKKKIIIIRFVKHQNVRRLPWRFLYSLELRCCLCLSCCLLERVLSAVLFCRHLKLISLLISYALHENLRRHCGRLRDHCYTCHEPELSTAAAPVSLRQLYGTVCLLTSLTLHH